MNEHTTLQDSPTNELGSRRAVDFEDRSEAGRTKTGMAIAVPGEEGELSRLAKTIRARSGLKASEMAKECGISSSLILKMENRERVSISARSAMKVVRWVLRTRVVDVETLKAFMSAAKLTDGMVSENEWARFGGRVVQEHADLRHELVATTPAGHSLIVFARQAGEIAEIWKSGIPVTSRQLDLLAESHTRLVRDERAARLLMGVPG